MLTAERLRELLHYDPATGIFIRRVARTNAPAGSVAGSKHSGGYLTIWIDGRARKLHRLAWLYVYGHWPAQQIDHRDGDRSNNRIANLREANRSQNSQNIKCAYSNNKSSGLLGVYWHRQAQKWQAKIQIDGRSKSLGLYDNPSIAHMHYLNAKVRLHPFQTLVQTWPPHGFQKIILT